MLLLFPPLVWFSVMVVFEFCWLVLVGLWGFFPFLGDCHKFFRLKGFDLNYIHIWQNKERE